MMNCNVCASLNLNQVIALPNYPLNSIYLTKSELINTEKYKPRDFSLYICEKCGLFQALSSVELDEFYNDDYNYQTQNSGVQGRVSFFLSQLNTLESIKFNRVIDIGCYDLSLLKAVKEKIQANHFIGVDPSMPNYCLENQDGILCFKDYVDNVELPYFSSELPDLIISDQTFEHIPTINSTLGNVVQKVSEDSVFAICVPSLEVLIEKLNFHNLIHEHLNYFSIHTLNRLFTLNDLTLKRYTLNYVSTCGFLFGIFIKNRNRSNEVFLDENTIDKNLFLKYYDLFKSSIERTNEIIKDLETERIYGFGASDITANLAYFMNSDFSFLNNILDDTDYKQNRFIPFLKPEIKSPVEITDLNNSNCLITSPQAARYIYNRLNNFGFKKIINPIGLIA